MDLETENRIASVLLREAAELKRQAEKDGVRAYLEKPNVRHRPNSRFLTATVLGVKQSNRAVETNEMWKARELENERLKRKSREESSRSSSQMKRSSSFSKRSLDKRCSYINDERKITHQSSSDKRLYLDDDDEGLGDDEIESFLQSRNKRGRGSVGPRMDETGPYLPTEKVDQLQSSDTRERKAIKIQGFDSDSKASARLNRSSSVLPTHPLKTQPKPPSPRRLSGLKFLVANLRL